MSTMAGNHITTDDFSNPETKKLYLSRYEGNPVLQKQMCEDCSQCGGCSCFAPLNGDYGVCCSSKSKHHLETVFEHFSCEATVQEGWGAHSFHETHEEQTMMQQFDEPEDQQ